MNSDNVIMFPTKLTEPVRNSNPKIPDVSLEETCSLGDIVQSIIFYANEDATRMGEQVTLIREEDGGIILCIPKHVMRRLQP